MVSILKLAKDIQVPARQNLSVRLDFTPFGLLNTSEKYMYDDEGRFYRYVAGQPSFARYQDDVKDAPDCDWWFFVNRRNRFSSKTRKLRSVMPQMMEGMGCYTALSRRMGKLARVLKEKAPEIFKERRVVDASGTELVMKAVRCALYFQGLATDGDYESFSIAAPGTPEWHVPTSD